MQWHKVTNIYYHFCGSGIQPQVSRALWLQSLTRLQSGCGPGLQSSLNLLGSQSTFKLFQVVAGRCHFSFVVGLDLPQSLFDPQRTTHTVAAGFTSVRKCEGIRESIHTTEATIFYRQSCHIQQIKTHYTKRRAKGDINSCKYTLKQKAGLRNRKRRTSSKLAKGRK